MTKPFPNGGPGRAAQTADQRRAPRDEVEAEVTLELETEPIPGVSDNLSDAGIMLFTDQPIRCSVTVVGPDGPRRLTGRVVRLQRMNEHNTGLAVEFDAN